MRAVSAARTFQDHHLVRACAAIRRSSRSYHMQEAGSLFENRPLPLVAGASSYQRSSSSVASLRLSYPGPAKPVVVTVLVNRDPLGSFKSAGTLVRIARPGSFQVAPAIAVTVAVFAQCASAPGHTGSFRCVAQRSGSACRFSGRVGPWAASRLLLGRSRR